MFKLILALVIWKTESESNTAININKRVTEAFYKKKEDLNACRRVRNALAHNNSWAAFLTELYSSIPHMLQAYLLVEIWHFISIHPYSP